MSGAAGSAETIARWAAREIILLHSEPANDAPPCEKRRGDCSKCRRHGCLLLFWAKITMYLITPGNVSNEPVSGGERVIPRWTGTEYPAFHKALRKAFRESGVQSDFSARKIREWEAGGKDRQKPQAAGED